MPDLKAAIRYAEDQREQSLQDLITLLRIPSVSTLPEHESDMHAAAEWIAERLRDLGFESVAIMPTARHPVVYGEWMQAGPQAPTILIYGHYDVQPADPLDEWTHDPFDPQIRGENIYARGASDMKGQLVASLRAVEAMLKTSGMPINVKYMLEGEEEIGSPSLEGFIREHKDMLRCDVCLNTDAGILAPDQPAITYALRGLAYFEIRLRGAATDLHSGTFGGVIDNPAIVLCKLIAGMRGDDGRITLPGFYDDVRELSPEEIAGLPDTPDSWWLERAGARKLFGEKGYDVNIRARARPTLDVNGLLSGFIGEGSKTVLPAKAMAKVSMRLVPDQRPERIRQILEAYLKEHMPDTMTWELLEHAGAPPAIIERDSDAVRAASEALEAVWGVKPVFDRQGGTVPVVAMIKDVLGVESLMLGFGLPSDNIHGPDEKQHLPNFYRGIETYIRFAHIFAAA